MSKYSWNDTTNKQITELCLRCHWRDKDPDLCHAIEPPIVKLDTIMNGEHITQDCGFIPDSYWDRIPQERKDKFNKDVEERSKLFYKK